MGQKITTTSDGSFTLYSEEFDETYHSINGSITESTHVFIDAGYNLAESTLCNVLEIGFGTGLNAFLTFLQAEKLKKTTIFHTIERYPLSSDIYNQLNYPEILDINSKDSFLKLHESDWGKQIKISEYFFFTKFLDDFGIHDFGDNIYNIIYFDAFSPSRQPDAWTNEIFAKMFRASKSGGIITTYCAKGSVRRMMKAAGFEVYRLPGPPGKREMLKGVKV